MNAAAPISFFVVGAQRGGSTQLSARLASHPDIYLPGDEVPYFEDPFFVHSSPAALAETMAPALPRQLPGIHCPSYLARSEVAPRLAEAYPEARIVVVLRDPVERALSAYFWYVQFSMLPLLDPEEGLARLLDGRPDPAYPQSGEILDWSLYGRHLGRYVEHFGRERVAVVSSDELDAAGTLAGLYRFLGVDPAHRPGPLRVARNPGVYDLRRLRFLRIRSRLAWSWAETSEYTARSRRRRHPVRFLPNAAVVAVDRVVLARLFTGRQPQLSPGLQDRLRQHFRDDIEVLEKVVGQRFPAWKR